MRITHLLLAALAVSVLMSGCEAPKVESKQRLVLEKEPKKDPLQFSHWRNCLGDIYRLTRANVRILLFDALALQPEDVDVCQEQKVWVVRGGGVYFTTVFAKRVTDTALTAEKVKRIIVETMNSSFVLSIRVDETIVPASINQRLVIVTAFRISPPRSTKYYLSRIPIELRGQPYWLFLLIEGQYPEEGFVRRTIEDFLKRTVAEGVVTISHTSWGAE